ncbi:DMP19 family protein [Brevibacillus dissolubilis]|uniref:DMP19 family protein n=1 Tax=Brevibacillus dissolubilis TaxID=1844116 RepID=UPI001115DF84|nr:DUF4375 domain-containing protein [Brevibacillus dissolubilis]
MFAILTRTQFDSLEPDALSWACFEPTVLQIRGKSTTVKSQVYEQLNTAQQALFMFRVLYDHARGSAVEFYSWVSHLLIESGTWSEVKRGLRFFGDAEMLRFLEETEAYLESRNRQNDGTWREVRPSDLEADPDLSVSVDQLNTEFHRLASATLARIAAYIRSHPDEFVQITD